MYNYHTFLKDKQINNKCDQIKRQYYKTIHHRQRVSPSLVHSHKKRIQGYILTMIDKPIKVNQHINHSPSFRIQDKSKNLSSNAFYLKKETQIQRINQSMRKNSELDQVPFNNTFSHQFRDLNKSQKNFKYKPFNHNLRIKQYIDTQPMNYLPNSSNKKIDKNLKKILKKDIIDFQTLNKKINKSLLPILHNKTYFKSVENLYTILPETVVTKKSGEKQSNNEDHSNVENQPKKQASKNNSDRLCRKQNSRQALIKCNMLSLIKNDKENIFHK